MAPNEIHKSYYGPLGPHVPGKKHSTDEAKFLPLVTLGVAQRSRESADLWGHLVSMLGCKPGLQQPSLPWCAVALHAPMVAFPDAVSWLGDLERCIAWAWVTRNRENLHSPK
jgi:hypothetical protein